MLQFDSICFASDFLSLEPSKVESVEYVQNISQKKKTDFCLWIQHDALPISHYSLFRFFVFWGKLVIIDFFLSRYSLIRYHVCYVRDKTVPAQ